MNEPDDKELNSPVLSNTEGNSSGSDNSLRNPTYKEVMEDLNREPKPEDTLSSKRKEIYIGSYYYPEENVKDFIKKLDFAINDLRKKDTKESYQFRLLRKFDKLTGGIF